MKGDFSRWEFDPDDNFNGVLHQQGRVFLDSDGSDQTRIFNHWQDTAAQDVIGSGVAAVPTTTPNAFKVIQAQAISPGSPATPIGATITLLPGHLWADGLLLHLEPEPGKSTVIRTADHLGTLPTNPLESGDRDAVILEVWREAINGYQRPDKLLEPALGGPDTTERVHTAMALRLLRLAENETCENIGDRLRDNLSSKGKLTVTLQPTTIIPGDCPVVEGGGYTGFEHYLYRIEIAQLNAAQPVHFKWSQFNGGLVGRGDCALGGPDKKITITANNLAIQSANLETFYLEVVELDPDRGYWRVTYGAEVTLNGDVLEVASERYTESSLPTDNVFFRLWNGIRPISEFPIAPSPTELLDGIRLAFDATASGNYRAGDYWTFKVRAGEIAHPDPLLDKAPPKGIYYHRVPLAELHWNAAGNISFDAGEIEDCRKVFRPLTNQRVCCTILVGDGIRSQGDYNSIEEALDHLPPQGGKICLMPGIHSTNAVIQNRQNIRITGCGSHTIVHPRLEQPNNPIFRILASQQIQLDDMTLVTNTGTAIQLIDPARTEVASQGLHVLRNQIVALTHAVEVRVNNEKAGDNDIWIGSNKIAMLDSPEGDVAIFSNADRVLIEKNQIVVVPAPDPDRLGDPREPGDPSDEVFDPCAKTGVIYGADFPVRQFIYSTFQYITLASSAISSGIVYQTRSGIQIAGGSEFVTIRGNQIIGGRGNGITFGDLPVIESPREEGVLRGKALAYATFPKETLSQLEERFNSTLYNITIAENTIQAMGLSGIGVEAFFSLERVGLLIRVEDLTIYRNSITHCAQQIPDDLPDTMLGEIGLGGIVLTACDRAIIQENRIENNGISSIDPICGVFILFGDKIDITNNIILNNGKLVAKTPQRAEKPGLRGGIFVSLSFASKPREILADIGEAFQNNLPFDDGIPAVKVHGNVVTQPLGQALFIVAIGPVSVVGNQFTSQDVDPRADLFTLLAGAVFILNLGFSILELLGLLLTAQSLMQTNFPSYQQATADNNGIALAATTNQNPLYGLFWPSGKVLFNDNQTTLDLRDTQSELTLSSQFIFSLDDIGFSSNQSDCNLLLDWMLTNTWIIGFSVRTNDNRFREGFFAFLSLFSFGLMNTNTNNQGTHCFLALASQPQFRVDKDNIVLINQICNPLVQKLTEQYR